MLPTDPEGKMGPKQNLADVVTIIEPKEEPRMPKAEPKGYSEGYSADKAM